MVCSISITTDGINYSESEEKFKIYNSNINLQTLAPKSGSVKGGSELTIYVDIDEQLQDNLFHLLVGFQPKQKQSKGGLRS